MQSQFQRAYRKIGRYRIEREIASGGMAIVYLARLMGAAGFTKEFALKKILPQWSHDPEFVRMLVDEAKILTRLKHKNIVEVFELGCEQSAYYIVMEFVDGMNLRELLKKLERKKTVLPIGLSLFIVREVAEGLSFAHAQKDEHGRQTSIIHRDVSPQNILVSHEGGIKITDFGIAKIAGKSQHTQTGQLKGKFSYMSPEQARGEALTPQSDIFALGLILFELVTGKKCFCGSNDLEILEKVRNTKIHLPENIPAEIKNILLRALHPQASQRYQDILALQEDITAQSEKYGHETDVHDLKIFLEMPQEATQLTVVNLPQTVIHEATRVDIATKIQNPAKAIIPGPKPRTQPIPKKYSAFPTRTVLYLLILFGLLPAYFLSQAVTTPFSRHIKFLRASLIEPAYFDDVKKLHVAIEPAAPQIMPLPPSAPQVFTKKTELPPEPEPTFGSLSVVARPWAIVSVDGSPKAETPAHFAKLITGKHNVLLFFPPLKKSITRAILVAEGETTNCQASFGTQPQLNCR